MEFRESNKFWEELYTKIKVSMASLRGLKDMKITGRALVANFKIFSRPRYWAFTMDPPEWFNEQLITDVNHLMWDKHPALDPEEEGSYEDLDRAPWIKNPHAPRRLEWSAGGGPPPNTSS